MGIALMTNIPQKTIGCEIKNIMQSNCDTLEKIEKAINIIFPFKYDKNDFILKKKLIDHMLWFYLIGKTEPQYKGKNTQQKIFSYECDDEYVYSAFLDQYGIDLQDIKYLHWWKYRSMFKSLKADNEIVKIMGYRALKLSNKMSKEMREFYSEMKKIYEIPLPKEEQKFIDEITEALQKGKPLKGLL